MTPGSKSIRLGPDCLLYLAALAFGVALRLVYPSDVHYLPDQIYNYTHGMSMGSSEPWSWLGMNSSAGFRNPGMSTWVFVLLVKLFGVTRPVQLARAVATLNIAALVLVGVWAAVQMRGPERREWLAAGALAAVNPAGIWLQRTIWAPSTLPFFVVLFWIGLWNRRRWWGALLWGAIGACLGQVQLAGFFAASGVFLWVLLFRRRSANWWAFGIGTALTAWPVLFWLTYVVHGEYTRTTWTFWQHFPGKVWLWWLLTDSGLSAKYLASNLWMTDFFDFLKEPRIAGAPTYGMLLIHALLAFLMARAILLSVLGVIRRRASSLLGFLGGDTETAFILRAALIGFGGLISLMPAPVFVHYFLTVFPIGFVWVARLLSRSPFSSFGTPRLPLVAAVVLQLLISLTAAAYVHRVRGAPPDSFGLRMPQVKSIYVAPLRGEAQNHI